MNAVTKEQQTALSLPERAAVALGASEHETKLRELVKSSADIVAVIDPAGREQAHRIGMNLKGARVAIEKVGKAAREDATAFSKAIIAEEKRLIAIAEPEEGRILGLRDRFDAVEQARKDALIAAERARVEAIQADIERLRAITPKLIGKSADDLAFALRDMQSMKVEESRFAEFTEAAGRVVADVIASIEGMHAAAVEREAAALAAEQARIAEAARLEAEKVELAKQRAENERIANEQAAERQRLANLAAAQEAERVRIAEQAAANLRQEREAQEEAMRIDREKQAAAQAEIDRARNELAEQQATHAAAIARQQADAQRDHDHAEALADNATFDAAMTRLAAVDTPTFTQPDLARCNGMVATARADASLAAYHDAGLDDPELTDEEITAWGAEVGLDKPALIVRLRKYIADSEAAE